MLGADGALLDGVVMARVAAAASLAVVALFAVAGAFAPWSLSGWLMLAVGALLALAVSVRRRRRLIAVAGAAFLVLVGVRVFGHGDMRMLTLPGGGSRWAGRTFDEQDVSLVGARILPWFWHLPADERDRLLPAMRSAYVEMRSDVGGVPSPVLDTMLRRQSPAAFDTLVVEPRVGSRTGVIFLHGYAGSFAVECWLVARAAQAIGAVTVCPATEFPGHWSEHNHVDEGAHIVQATLDHLRARGIERVYLAGLSNGAVGAAALASHFPSLAGLILISGAPSTGGSARLPTLVLQGDHDPMARASTARAFAARTHASYVSFDAGHFVLLVRREETRAAIAAWLGRQEGRN